MNTVRNSYITCVSFLFPDKLSYIEGIEQYPDYLVGIDQKTADNEQFYDESTDVISASSVSMVTMSVVLYVAVAFCVAEIVS